VRLGHRREARRRKLPIVRHVGVEIREHHNAPVRVVAGKDRAEHRRSAIIVLMYDVERVDVEERMKDWVRGLKISKVRVRKDSLEVRLDVRPSPVAGTEAVA